MSLFLPSVVLDGYAAAPVARVLHVGALLLQALSLCLGTASHQDVSTRDRER